MDDLFVCPDCGRGLTQWTCDGCARDFAAPDDIPDLRPRLSPSCSMEDRHSCLSPSRTEQVRQFYEAAPFPGYPERDSIEWLRLRAGRSDFARMLDRAIPADATIADVGCGTGQMSLFLARAGRRIVAADLTRASLRLGAAAARRFGIDRVQFVQSDLHRPALRRGAFDVVYSSGVLHHTPNPKLAFARVAELARPGGWIIVGLYNALARLPLRVRRIVARLSGYRWTLFDPVLRDRANEPERREAWLRDQYQHPEEHRHTLGEVQRWFAGNGVDYVRSYPSALLATESDDLFEPAADAWAPEQWLAQIGWMSALGHEGGLFVTVGRRSPTPAA